MRKLVQKIAAGAAVVAGALLLTPTAAQALSYPDDSQIAVSQQNNLQPGGTVTLSFTGFDPGQAVTFTLTGENATGATLAAIKTAVNTQTRVLAANGAGALSMSVTLPADAACTYTLTAVSGSWTRSWPLNVAGCLATTGAEQQPALIMWAGAGGLALLGGGLVVAGAVRKQRKLAE